jgi:hypothetical protein
VFSGNDGSVLELVLVLRDLLDRRLALPDLTSGVAELLLFRVELQGERVRQEKKISQSTSS